MNIRFVCMKFSTLSLRMVKARSEFRAQFCRKDSPPYYFLYTNLGLLKRKIPLFIYTGRFIRFSVITNIYNKKAKGPNSMELFTPTGKLKMCFFFFYKETFDVCTTGDTARLDMILKFLPHTRQHGCIDILHCCNDPCL